MQPLSTAFSPTRNSYAAAVIKPTEIVSGESSQFIRHMKSPSFTTEINFDILHRLQPDAKDAMKYATPVLSDGSQLFLDLSIAGQCTMQATSPGQNPTSLTLTPRHPLYATIVAIPGHLSMSPTAHLLKLNSTKELAMSPGPSEHATVVKKHHFWPSLSETHMKTHRKSLTEKFDIMEMRPVFSPTKTSNVYACLTWCLKYEVKPTLAEKWAFLEIFRRLYPQSDDPQNHYATPINSDGHTMSVHLLKNKMLQVELNALNKEPVTLFIEPQHPLYPAITTSFPASLIAHE